VGSPVVHQAPPYCLQTDRQHPTGSTLIRAVASGLTRWAGRPADTMMRCVEEFYNRKQ